MRGALAHNGSDSKTGLRALTTQIARETTMREQLLAVCRQVPADYVEVRLHEGCATTVHYAGKELDDIGERTGLGGCVRVLKNGGWGFAAFNDMEDMENYARLAAEQAELAGAEPLVLAPIEPRQATYHTPVDIDPAEIPLAEKQQLCYRYNQKMLAHGKIRTTVVKYRDSHATGYFANSEGTFIEQEYVFCGVMLAAIAIEGTNVQRAYVSNGDLRGFSKVQGMEKECEDVVERAVDLLGAKPIEGGAHTVIVDPKLCGVFVHEAFGHLSEADFIYENPRLQQIMQPGRRFGEEFLHIIDDGSIEGEAGFVAFDSEGVPGQRTPLIENGVLTGRLHNRETAARMNAQPTGNARAISYTHPPIVRMTSTFMEAGEWSFEEMLQDTEDGIYAKGMLGGQTNMEMFTFSAEEAYRIEKGRIGEKLREVVLTGNVFQTLKNIDAVGSDKKMHGGLGGCGKGGQSPLRVSDGGPHCRIRNVVIGGR